MEEIAKRRNIDLVDALMDAQDERKLRLVDRAAIADSVGYLQQHGFNATEIARCLVRYFYVDLDMLNEALTPA